MKTASLQIGLKKNSVSRAKKNIVSLSVIILFSVMAILGLTGCSKTPKIYKMLPDDLEGIRSGFRKIGVTISSYPLKYEINKPAKGITGGASRGIVIGASTPVVIGAISPVPGGTLLGLLVVPYTAVAGGLYGLTKGVPAKDIEKAEAANVQAVDRLKKMNLRQNFIEEVVKLGKERTGFEFVALPELGPRDPDEVVRYDRVEIRNVDTVLELRFEKTGLWGPYSFDPPSLTFIEVNVRLIRARDNEVVISETFFCSSEEERKYIEWSENEGQMFFDELFSCFPELAEKIIDDLFLVYPRPSR